MAEVRPGFFQACLSGVPEMYSYSHPGWSFLADTQSEKSRKKNSATRVVFSDLIYNPEFFAIYEKHSRIKFNQDSSEEDFYRSFFQPAVPSFQSEYYADGKLFGFGILDQASTGLSSVYFAYDPDFSSLSPGTFSILAEIEETRRRGLDYYYSGYYIEECSRMSYKGRFRPYELLIEGQWTPELLNQKNP